MRYALAVLMAVAGLAGCQRSSGYNGAEVRRLTMPSPLLTTPGVTPWSTYAATDYGKRGQPKLTRNETAQLVTYLREVSRIDRTRARLIPGIAQCLDGLCCPTRFRPTDGHRVARRPNGRVFYGAEPGGVVLIRERSHVFGEPNLLYMKDGELVARPTGETSDRAAVDSEPCFK